VFTNNEIFLIQKSQTLLLLQDWLL